MLKNNIEKCRAARKPRAWSKSMLAKQLGVSRSYITLLEQGRRKPSAELLFRMSEVLGCPVTEIYDYLPPEKEPG